MMWIYVALAVPVALLMGALVHDFFAGLDVDRLWSDPVVQDPQSLIYRSAAAGTQIWRTPEEPSANTWSSPGPEDPSAIGWSLAG